MAAGSAPLARMIGSTGRRLGGAHRSQVRREPWPDFDAFDPAAWSSAERRLAARQWASRARNEHGSVQQFSQLTQVLTSACVELELLGVLARMITDEIRHAELCARMALIIWPEHSEEGARLYPWPAPRPPWPDPPSPRAREEPTEARLIWAAQAILTACCLGETLSKPMLEALLVVTTEATARAVIRQILRDELLHATFGFEALALLLPRLSPAGRTQVQAQLAPNFAGFERSVCGDVTLSEVAGTQLVIEADAPNLGVLSEVQYAAIFYSCLETEIFPKLRQLELDPELAWRKRLVPR